VTTILLLLGRRTLMSVPILLTVSILLFVALRLLPVDPAAMSMPPNATIEDVETKRREMGLDKPLPAQYAIWLRGALHGDFGKSIQLRRDAARLVTASLPATIQLALCAMLIAAVLGLGGGLLLFHLRGGTAETLGDLGTTVLLSVPEFLWALLFILLFGVLVPVLPFIGQLGPQFSVTPVTGFLLIDTLMANQPAAFASALAHLALPAAALGIAFSPAIMRVLRSSLLDVYQEDYIRQARLRGIGEWRILIVHALPNAILPTLTLMGVQFGFLFGGTLLVEVIYSYPGLGNLMVDAVRNADLPIIQTVGLTYCIMVLLIGMTVDALVLILNPRLRGS
jgi:ABC-type dipeptide/oligopeptide/nickel transport system permease component